MKKIGGLDPFTLVVLVLLTLCAGVLGFEGMKRMQRPVPQQQAAPASAPAPAEQPAPEAPAAEQPPPSGFVGNG